MWTARGLRYAIMGITCVQPLVSKLPRAVHRFYPLARRLTTLHRIGKGVSTECLRRNNNQFFLLKKQGKIKIEQRILCCRMGIDG